MKKKLIKNGRRIDGRKPEELREFEIEAGVLERADGSAYARFGETKVIVAVYGPRELHPKHLERPDRAILRCRYSLAPFSTEERIRPGYSRRNIEISKVITEALAPAIFLEEFPRTAIDVFIEILQADAGTRCVGITAAAVALANAGIPMRDLVTAVAAGKVDGQVVLDLCGEEDNYGEGDIPLALMPQTKQITLLQMDGRMTIEEVAEAIDLCMKACDLIYKKQKLALKKKYKEVREKYG